MPRLAARQGRPSTALLGQRVRAERERLGLTQEVCAQRLHVSRGSYRQTERVCTLQYGVILAMVRDLGFDPRRLVPELFDAGTARAERASQLRRLPTPAPKKPRKKSQ